jgi:hypothetical protein
LLLVFVKDVSLLAITQRQEGRKHQQMKEVWNGISCRRSSSDVRRNITRYRDFTKTSIPYFEKWFAENKNCARWVPHSLTAEQKQNLLEIATLLKQRFNVEGIELSLLTKRGLETLNPSWNRSQTSGEVQTPRDPTNFEERNQRAIKWWSLLMITEVLSWQSSMWNNCDSNVFSWLVAKITQKNAQNRPDLLEDGPLILHDNAHPHLGKVVTDLLSKYEWEVLLHGKCYFTRSVTSRVIQSRHQSTGIRLIPQVKRAHVWTPFSLPGRGFCRGYSSHLRTEKNGTLNGKQIFRNIGMRSLSSRIVMRYFLK